MDLPLDHDPLIGLPILNFSVCAYSRPAKEAKPILSGSIFAKPSNQKDRLTDLQPLALSHIRYIWRYYIGEVLRNDLRLVLPTP